MSIKMTAAAAMILIASVMHLANGQGCMPACGESLSCSAAYESTGCAGWSGSQGGYSENQGCSADSAGGQGYYDNSWGPATNDGEGYACPCSASNVPYAS